MKKLIFWLCAQLVGSLLVITASAQHSSTIPERALSEFSRRGEIYLRIKITDQDMFTKVARLISVDNVDQSWIYAYASFEDFKEFLNTGFYYEILTHPSDLPAEIRMAGPEELRQVTSWDFYPTYEGYLSMMNQFAANYPHLCQVFSIGTTVQGRQLMMAKISKNVQIREPEPRFLYTGTIHGDELTGYNLLLRLIDYLLSSYGNDPKVTYLLDNTEIWINPLANPDGTYKGGNNTVNYAVRYNANNVDLNRNFPDPAEGPHPDGKAWQPETIAFMQLAENTQFAVAGNTHGGAEVMNYPWDTWQRLHPDNSWWIYVCRSYVDTVHLYSPPTYMTYLNNGITNGYAWYRITGGRQDFMNYFHHCREMTMELSNVKKLPVTELNNHWNYNYRSMLNYIAQCTYGIAGTVTDAVSGQPLVAEIWIENHDADQSQVYSEPVYGFYQRPIDSGIYTVTYSVPGYESTIVENVIVQRNQKTILNVQMHAGPLNPKIKANRSIVATGEQVDFTDLSTGLPVAWQWTFQGGQPSSSSARNPSGIVYSNPGSFDVVLTITNANGASQSRIFRDFIRVAPVELMSNKTVTTCNALFFDSGNQNGNYSNNQNFIMTFYPGQTGGKIRVEFIEFSVEPHSSCGYDWLKIYDGPNTSSPLLGTWCGINSPGILTATNQSGALTFQFKSDASVTAAGWKALISCLRTETLSLGAGWSGISSSVSPLIPQIESITSPIAQNLVIMYNSSGIFFPQQNINTLQTWNSRDAYLIKLSAPGQLTLTGIPLFNKTLYLQQGWNLIPVPVTQPVPVALFANLLGTRLTMIKEATGNTVYWPSYQIQTLVHLLPGKAYWIHLNEPVQIIFPEP